MTHEDEIQAIIDECDRQSENCLYTSTSLFIWLRDLRWQKRMFIVAQVIFSVCAASFAVAGNALLAGAFGATAGLFPIVWDALKMDAHENLVQHHASLFVELRDRFRQIRNIEVTRGIETFKRTFEDALSDLAAARKASITAPEKYFVMAKDKIENGHYDNEVDAVIETSTST